MAQEFSSESIARQLRISERTVETYRKNMLVKTGSRSVLGLLLFALCHALLTL